MEEIRRCPKCKSEYRQGFYQCTDCGVDLVYELPVEKEEKADHGEPLIGNLVVVAAFDHAHEAHLFKSVLLSEGIRCTIDDEHTVSLLPHYSLFLGGIKVLVSAGDVEQAKVLYKRMGEKQK